VTGPAADAVPGGAVPPRVLGRGLCIGVLGAWWAYLMVAPTLGLGWIDSWHNEQRAAQIVLLALSAAAFGVAMRDGALRHLLPPVPWPVAALFALGLASAALRASRTICAARCSLCQESIQPSPSVGATMR